jgi:hypothetical protein
MKKNNSLDGGEQHPRWWGTISYAEGNNDLDGGGTTD